MRRPAKRLRTMLAGAGCALLCVPPSASGAEVLPDLRAVPPQDVALEIVSGRLVVAMNGYILNTGPGPAELRGSAQVNGLLTDVRQVIRNDDGSESRTVVSPGVVRFEQHGTHNHFHLQAAARYSLWSEDAQRLVALSAKTGFCLTDSSFIGPSGPPRTYQSACSPGNPNPLSPVVMGISPGWRDDYPSSVAYQWVDVSEVTPGRYRLGAEVDPDGIFLEADEANPLAFSEPTTIVPGYVPEPLQAGTLNPFVGSKLRLKASAFVRNGGTLGPASFAITEGPSCGRLSLAPGGGPSTDPVVEYTPARRCRGKASFEFSVRDSASAFPLAAPTARVNFSLGSRDALGRPRASVRGRRLLLRVRSRYSGRVKLSAAKGGRGLGVCSARAPAGRRARCGIPLGAADLAALRNAAGRIGLGNLRLRAALRLRGKVVDRSQASLARRKT